MVFTADVSQRIDYTRKIVFKNFQDLHHFAYILGRMSIWIYYPLDWIYKVLDLLFGC